MAVYEVGPEPGSEAAWDYMYKYYREGAMLSDQEMATRHWKKLAIVFYAYATQQPGTREVYEEFNLGPNAGDDGKLNYAARSANESANAGYARQRLAFYAHEYTTDLVPIYVYEEFQRGAYYRLSSSLNLDYKDGWSRQVAGFRAHRTQVGAAVPIYEEKNSNGVYQYSLSKVANSGWERLSVAFYACKNPQPGTVPVYVETPRQTRIPGIITPRARLPNPAGNNSRRSSTRSRTNVSE